MEGFIQNYLNKCRNNCAKYYLYCKRHTLVHLVNVSFATLIFLSSNCRDQNYTLRALLSLPAPIRKACPDGRTEKLRSGGRETFFALFYHMRGITLNIVIILFTPVSGMM